MKTLTAAAAIAALLLVQSAPAQASPACNGCNLVDEGTLNSSLVGQKAYLGATPYTVTGVDAAKQIVFLRTASGGAAWGYAREFYSQQARSERNANWAMAGAGVGLVLACLFGACSSGNSFSSSSSSAASERQRLNARDDAEMAFERNQQRDRNYNSCGQAYC